MAYSNFFFELLHSPSVEKAKELSTFIINLLVSFGEKNESSWFGVKMMHVNKYLLTVKVANESQQKCNLYLLQSHNYVELKKALV